MMRMVTVYMQSLRGRSCICKKLHWWKINVLGSRTSWFLITTTTIKPQSTPTFWSFTKKTTVYDLREETFPNKVYNFHQFDALQSLRIVNDKLLIGEIALDAHCGITTASSSLIFMMCTRMKQFTSFYKWGDRDAIKVNFIQYI
ncbi:unnamed protein product [Cuscuta europaea]|uniref:Uncharacterized protein n=1 Tax=Cuscuta europaea TaxID=41803 RepID=A0A9P0ZSU3_CUSEU|nr:unnamed protein product [Cuscuta europaea]